MSTQKTLLGVLLGFAAGAAVGVLLAPRSGKQTREILKKKGEKAKDDLSHLLDQGYEQWKTMRNKVVDRANMTKADIKDFLHFMSAEGADLKDRVMSDGKDTVNDMVASGKRAADRASRN